MGIIEIFWEQFATGSILDFLNNTLVLTFLIFISVLIGDLHKYTFLDLVPKFLGRIGIIIHELLHTVFAILTFGKVNAISLFSKDGGSVKISRWIPILTNTIAALAPLFWALFILLLIMFEPNFNIVDILNIGGWKLYLWGLIVFLLFPYLNLSFQDFKVWLPWILLLELSHYTLSEKYITFGKIYDNFVTLMLIFITVLLIQIIFGVILKTILKIIGLR